MTLLWGARTMKPDLSPRICPLCDSPCRLAPGSLRVRRGDKELHVDTWWWKCLGDGCDPDTGKPLSFVDKDLGEWQQEQIERLWQERFGELLPGGRRLESTRVEKVTELKGYYATGDHECFCFGKHPHPDALRSWVVDNLPEGVERDSEDYWKLLIATEDSTRVYPNDLIPEAVGERKGRWRITVEFWPDED